MATAASAAAIAPHKIGSCRSDDVTLNYRLFGKPGKLPILINHGLSYFSFDWIGIAAELALDREVAAFDMRGFGDSSPSPEKKYGIKDYAADIIALMDQFKWTKAVVVGHSMGGRNVTFCAAENPTRMGAIVCVDMAPQNAPQGSDRIARSVAGVPDTFPSVDAAIVHFGRDAKDPLVRARFEAYLRPVPGGFAIKRDPIHKERMQKSIATGERPKPEIDMWQVLAKVNCPILVVRGAQSDMFAADIKDRVRSTNKMIALVEVDGGHNVGGDNPKGLTAEIIKFLRAKEL